MIKVQEHRLFKRYIYKLSAKQRILFVQRLEILCNNPKHPLLNIYRLKGELRDFYSFSLVGDLRVRFKWIDKNIIRLYKIGTHNQVY